MAAVGVTHFALFLDDVLPTLQHERDRQQFTTLADAHSHLTNRLYEDLSARGAELAVTPTTYTNAWGDREYLRRLGQGVVPQVPFFWTGVDVAAPEITAQQAQEWGELIARSPLIWDNYPVNDYARWRPFLGPVRGRARDLGGHVAGILANPMNEAHASMIPLATLADYARDPGGYDPERSLRGAVERLHGRAAAELLWPFVEIYGDYGWNANLFEPLFIPGPPIDLAAVEAGLARLDDALRQLDSAAVGERRLRALVQELTPFVAQTAERFHELRNDPAYEQRDGQLVFRAELGRLIAGKTRSPVAVDGDLGEWDAADWRAIHGPEGGPTAGPRAAILQDPDYFYVALRVPAADIRVEPGQRIGAGHHVALVLQHDLDPGRNFLTPEDLVVLLPPPSPTGPPAPLTVSMDLRGFMAKFLADNRALRFSEFLLSTFGTPPAPPVAEIAGGFIYRVHRTAEGYQGEMALPRQGRDRARLSLMVVGERDGARTVHSLSRWNYPANPTTFVEVRAER